MKDGSDNGMSNRFRMDFEMKILSIDEETRTVNFQLTPNSKRYEWRNEAGKKYLYDKFDNLVIPEEVFEDFVKQAVGMPIYAESQSLGDAKVYVESRRSQIESFLDGHTPSPTFESPSDDFLEQMSDNNYEFVILSLDIVGSTKLATGISSDRYARLVQVVLYELSLVIPKFKGHVLKYVGDSIVAYFPAPSFITKNDLAFDCALALRRLVRDGLNPELKEKGYDPVKIRIGLDSGKAAVLVIGSPTTKQHKDIVGAVISLACKIQGCAPVDGIALGEVTLRNLHTDWRTICSVLDTGEEWAYIDPSTGSPYRVYKVNFQ